MSDNDHLANLSDGAGCAEVWEHLSEQREAEAAEAEDDSDEESTADADTADSAEDADAEQDAAAKVSCP